LPSSGKDGTFRPLTIVLYNGVRNEIYAVYGDASAFSTTPQFIVKWIRYFGAGKGT